MSTRSNLSRSLQTNRGLEKLEPYEGKLSCTVLRGERGSNVPDLPDSGRVETAEGLGNALGSGFNSFKLFFV